MSLFNSGAESAEERIIVFGFQPKLEDLEQCRELICYGTFATVPAIKFQLQTIHCVVGELKTNHFKYIPVLILMFCFAKTTSLVTLLIYWVIHCEQRL